MTETVTGFCPFLNREYSIDINYSHITGNRYLKAGADCDYNADATHDTCPMMKDCPLYLSMPKEKTY